MVHAILGVRASPQFHSRAADSKDRMDQKTRIAEGNEESANPEEIRKRSSLIHKISRSGLLQQMNDG
jgi:hypothetical protein